MPIAAGRASRVKHTDLPALAGWLVKAIRDWRLDLDADLTIVAAALLPARGPLVALTPKGRLAVERTVQVRAGRITVLIRANDAVPAASERAVHARIAADVVPVIALLSWLEHAVAALRGIKRLAMGPVTDLE